MQKQYGTSVGHCDYVLKHQLDSIKPKTVVDFGAGGGKNGRIVKSILKDTHLIAVEGFSETADMLRSGNVYDEVHSALPTSPRI